MRPRTDPNGTGRASRSAPTTSSPEFGGDEFALLPATGSSVADALAITQQTIAALELPFRVRDTHVVVGCSAGISAVHGDDPVDEVLRNADVAMYRAKADGKHRAQLFDPTMHRSISERHALTSDLGRSVSRGDLTVHCQPIVALGTGRIVGVEALVRWNHSRRRPEVRGRCVRALTRRAAADGTTSRMAVWHGPDAHRRPEKRWPLRGRPPSRANPSRDRGRKARDLPPRKTARLPEAAAAPDL